jgi:hypothetical protein
LLCSLLFLIRRKKETRPFFMRGTSNSGGSAPDTAGTIVVQLGTRPVPHQTSCSFSVTQGYSGCRLPCPRDIRVAVFRAPGISGSRRFSVPQGYPARGGFPCPRDFLVAAVFRAPGISGSLLSSVPQNNLGGCLPCPRKLRVVIFRAPMCASCSSSVSQLLHH